MHGLSDQQRVRCTRTGLVSSLSLRPPLAPFLPYRLKRGLGSQRTRKKGALDASLQLSPSSRGQAIECAFGNLLAPNPSRVKPPLHPASPAAQPLQYYLGPRRS